MGQYNELKRQYADAILLCRVGDFYEAFNQDAELISRVLGIALTGRDKDKRGDRVPMAGVPHHALNSHLYKLVDAGHKVAICEQMEDAKKVKGIVKRDVVRVVTPGTVTDLDVLNQKANNYLCAIYLPNRSKTYGLAVADLSTGEFTVTEVEGEPSLWAEINRFLPRECLFSDEYVNNDLFDRIRLDLETTINFMPDWRFHHQSARTELLRHFSTTSLDGFGCEHLLSATCAAGALMSYIMETQKQSVEHLTTLQTYTTSSFMVLDSDTQRNLELTKSMRDRTETGTLVDVIDNTITSMGGRKLRQWIMQPLLEVDLINSRLNAVEELEAQIDLQEELRDKLNQIYDIERLITRINLDVSNAREVLSLKNSLRMIPPIQQLLIELEAVLLQNLNDTLKNMDDSLKPLSVLIDDAIHPDPPVTITDGNLIRDGYHHEVDELRKLSNSGKDWIAQLQQEERERTGISSLKVGFNQVFGYYIEVTKTNLDLVPENYIRKQTLTNSERYITPELKEYEDKILNAEEKLQSLEYDLFCHIRTQIAEETESIQKVASAISTIDILANFAYLASKFDYTKPVVTDSDKIVIQGGRHPVVEQIFQEEGFVPNDVTLDCTQQQLHVITGPNMSGKSTFLRQVALITLLAQIGSFVPASAAEIGLVDRIFTRVGASDNLIKGQSTFLVEMNETANILNNATSRSLIILDEIGRGTSTFDGISIAWAVAEYILDQELIGAKTLFATHYHELVELANKYPLAKNFNVAVQENNEQITFLRRIVEGGTDQSYGIHVARLAGLPRPVIARAYEILEVLEQHNLSVDQENQKKEGLTNFSEANIKPNLTKKATQQTFRSDNIQMSMFRPKTHPIVEKLKDLDVNQITPMGALNLLYDLKNEAKK